MHSRVDLNRQILSILSGGKKIKCLGLQEVPAHSYKNYNGITLKLKNVCFLLCGWISKIILKELKFLTGCLYI